MKKWLRQFFCWHLWFSYLETQAGTVYKCCKCDQINNSHLNYSRRDLKLKHLKNEK
jgi:hypothetical protein